MQLRPYQLDSIDLLRQSLREGAKRPILGLPTGSGKCFAKDTKVMMYNGRIKSIQDIHVGELVMGWNSTPRKVTSLAHGTEMMYKVTPSKGESYTVNESHILSLKMTGNKSKSNGYAPNEVANISVRDYLKSSKTFKHCAKGWRMPVYFDNDSFLAIDPYYLGLWLGDGTSRNVGIVTTQDQEIIDYLYKYAEIKGYRVRQEKDNNHWQIHLCTDQKGVSGSSIKNAFEGYNLMRNKHIPHEYKTADISVRLQVIAGLIDSDGSLSGGCFDWINKNKRLAEDFTFLCRSVGLAAYISECKKSAYKGHLGTYYRVSVSGDCDIIPCLIERKKAKPRQQKKNALRVGIKVEPVGIGEYYGFELDGPDRMFLLHDFTVVHNTVLFSHLLKLALIKGSRVGVVAHRTELIDQAKATVQSYGLDANQIHFGMVQTYVRSPQKIPAMDLCIIDESHIGNFRRLIDLLPSYTQVIGVTATPIGASKKQPLNKVFDKVIYPIQIRELIEGGYLSRPEYHIWKLDESRLTLDFNGEFTTESQAKVFSMDNLVEAVQRRKGKTIIFCSSIEQSKKALDVIKSVGPVFLVHSKMSYQDRKFAVDLYKVTPNSIMVNCGILTAGFDDPTIETVIIYRATTSVALWLQMVGRGSRVTETKSKFYIFDLGNNHARLLPWEANRNWPNLFANQGKNLKTKEAARKACKNCESKIAASAKICPYCGFLQPIKAKEDQKANHVQVISSYNELPPHLDKPYQLMTVAELVERAAYGSPNLGRPFKVGWILGVLRDRDTWPADVRELARLKGYQSGWVKRQLM